MLNTKRQLDWFHIVIEFHTKGCDVQFRLMKALARIDSAFIQAMVIFQTRAGQQRNIFRFKESIKTDSALHKIYKLSIWR